MLSNKQHLVVLWLLLYKLIKITEAVARRSSFKKMFLQISQNLQENTCARVCKATLMKQYVGKACNSIKKETLAQ